LEEHPHAEIDLHLHSTASDGTLTPSEILARALDLGLKAIAIADHDCVDGAREALAIGIPDGIRFVTGVEISTSPPRFLGLQGSFHILGYAFHLEDPELNRSLALLQSARNNRNPKIIRRLNALGIDLTLNQVRRLYGDGQLGRPHIARALVEKGHAASVDDAFDRFLGTGKPAYVEKERIGWRRAIEIIRRAGGVAVLAHPALLNLSEPRQLEDVVGRLKAMGLGGIEVYYPEHSPLETAHYADLAKRHDLIMTGGTDFHGAIKPDVEMGVGRGNFGVPYRLYAKLLLRAAAGGRPNA
jgi:predicted metal-dependent phosphoesterase TrpH